MSNCLKCFYYHSESEYGDDYCGYHDKELDTLDSCNNFRISWSDKVNQLEQQLKEANEVAEFYGEKDSWNKDSQDYGSSMSTLWQITGKDLYEQNEATQYGGKTARQYLTKYKVKE